MTALPPSGSRGAVWKWSVCGMLLLASAINYMDRQTLSGLSVRITQEFAMTKTQYGQVEAVFGYSFAAGSLVFGWMADRFAVHRVYAAVLALWSLVGMSTGWAQNHQDLLIFRGLLGFSRPGIGLARCVSPVRCSMSDSARWAMACSRVARLWGRSSPLWYCRCCSELDLPTVRVPGVLRFLVGCGRAAVAHPLVGLGAFR